MCVNSICHTKSNSDLYFLPEIFKAIVKSFFIYKLPIEFVCVENSKKVFRYYKKKYIYFKICFKFILKQLNGIFRASRGKIDWGYWLKVKRSRNARNSRSLFLWGTHRNIKTSSYAIIIQIREILSKSLKVFIFLS